MSREKVSGVLTLVTPDLDVLDAALAGDAALARALGARVAPGWATFPEALPAARDTLATDPGTAEWGTRLFVAGDPGELVGWGGFKGPPRQGAVELGYEIAECRRGRGLATAAVHAMLEHAFAQPDVEAVIAHTLAESNASNRLLQRAGFVPDGAHEVDGRPVWRFRRRRDA